MATIRSLSVRKNMELYVQAMKMFSPLGPSYSPQRSAAPSKPQAEAEDDADINALKSQVEALQRKLDKLQGGDE